MEKGFLATAILLTCITTIYYTTSIQQTLSLEDLGTENYIKLNQRTQETKYRLTQGFLDSVKTSMKKTKDKEPIIREQLACEEVQRWLKNYNSGKRIKTKFRAGYMDPVTYKYKSSSKDAFKNIKRKIKEDPAQALGEYLERAVLCINHISIKGNKAVVKENGYLKESNFEDSFGEPSFIFHEQIGNTNQTVVIPSKTTIKVLGGD